MTAGMTTGFTAAGKPTIVVDLTCDVCAAQVIHTDSIPPAIVSTYLSNAGWVIVDADADHQTTLCPMCAKVAGAR